MTTVRADGWTVARSRVSLAGRVTAVGGGVASGGLLDLTPVPGDGRHNAASPPRVTARRYDTRILADGLYFFVDLPAGQYVLKGQDDRGNEIKAQQVSIPPAGGTGPLHVVSMDLGALPKAGSDERPPERRLPAVPPRRRRGSKSGDG
jgi:hypothetical protein